MNITNPHIRPASLRIEKQAGPEPEPSIKENVVTVNQTLEQTAQH
jgi:hypothetical protein